MKQTIPAYIHTGNDAAWNQCLSEIKPWDYVIMTGAYSRPDATFTADFHKRLAQVRAKKGIVFGYIPLSYGERSIKLILEDICRWVNIGVNRIFLDEVHTAHVYLEKYLDKLFKMPGVADNVIFNYGTYVQNPSIKIKRVTYEGSGLTPFPPFGVDDIALVYGIPTDQVITSKNNLIQAGCKNGYVTSDTLPNPWDYTA